jgi:hypothetical protein
MIRRPGMTRRQWLAATGACGLLSPFLRPRPALAAPPTPRLVLLMQSNGTSQANFWPAPGVTPLTSPILDPILKDPLLAPNAIVVKGLSNSQGGAGNGHDQGFSGLYSGYKSVGTFADPWGAGISLDQILRQKLTFGEPFPTLNCGVLASDTPPFKTHRRSFSYTGLRQQVPTEVDPYKLYSQFFPAPPRGSRGEDPVTAAKRRLRQKQSVLDYVVGDLKSLRTGLGAGDRSKLDAHEASLREVERRLGATLLPEVPRPARCVGMSPPAQGLDVTLEDNAPALVQLMFDFLAMALSCQLTRIVTFQFGHGGEKWYYRWLGINENSHDDIAHRDNGIDPVVTGKILKINVWYAEQVAMLARGLARIPEGEGTALDNTLIVWGNEIATGPHAMDDIPVVLLGKAAGRLKRSGYLLDQGRQDYQVLGTSLLNIMGVPATGLGEAPMCGPLPGLEV